MQISCIVNKYMAYRFQISKLDNGHVIRKCQSINNNGKGEIDKCDLNRNNSNLKLIKWEYRDFSF